jgi:hypothetical protein
MKLRERLMTALNRVTGELSALANILDEWDNDPIVTCCFCNKQVEQSEAEEQYWVPNFFVKEDVMSDMVACEDCAEKHLDSDESGDDPFLKEGHENNIQPPPDEIHDHTWVGPNNPAERFAWIEGGYPKWGRWLQIKFNGPITAELVTNLANKARLNTRSLRDLAYRLDLKGDAVPGNHDDMIMLALKRNAAAWVEKMVSMTYDQFYFPDKDVEGGPGSRYPDPISPEDESYDPSHRDIPPDHNGGQDFDAL